ncbi:MAG: glycosyltransferase family 2 protein [Alphaproteobacteria bacterium]|nr:glycosyltransferase family 2 protein [Alphaproteobacteria bacterium]
MATIAAATKSDIAVSIIVVSYNTRELTLAALRSVVAETTQTSYEIIVVDNASSDGSAEAIRKEFPDVRLYALDSNIGFAAANNRASVEARGDYLLLLNPDTIVKDHAVDRLVGFARCEPLARIWGGRTLFADGSLNPSSCWGRITLWNLFCRASGLTAIFKHNEIFNGEAYGGWQRDNVRAVDIVSGCFFLIRRNHWNELGGFSPVFFMYGEEADLCMRARAAGARPMVTPEATIVHLGGASERARTDKMIKLLAAKATLIERHFKGPSRPLAHALLISWPLTRWLAYAAAGTLSGSKTHRESKDIWQAIWAARAKWSAGYPMKVSTTRTVPAPALPGHANA